MRRLGLAIGIACVLTVSCKDSSLPSGDWVPSAPIDCKLVLAKRDVALMEPLGLTVWVYVEQEQQPKWEPVIPSGFVGKAEVLAARRDAGWLLRAKLPLRPVELGALTLPPFVIEVGELKTSTPAQELQVASRLAATHDRKLLEDPGQPLDLPFAWERVWWGAGGVVLLAVGVWWWLRRPGRRRALQVEVPVASHVAALRALSRLRQAERTTPPQIEAFYVEISRVLRTYLEARFGLHAPLRSTEEFLAEIEAGDDLRLSHRQSLKQFLAQCDLVKFGKFTPTEETHEQSLRIAEGFVEQTRPDALEEDASDAPRPKSQEATAGGLS